MMPFRILPFMQCVMEMYVNINNLQICVLRCESKFIVFSLPKDEAANYNPNLFCVPVILLTTASLIPGSLMHNLQNA